MGAALKIVLWLGSFYATLAASALAIEITAPKHQSVDIFRDYPRSIYVNSISFAAYGLDRLDNSPRQAFIIGGSPSGLGFLPDPIMSDLKQYKVHNLCIAGANVTEMGELVDLIEEHVSLAQLDHPVFIIGGHFMSFMENERRYGGAVDELQQELLRHRVLRIADGHPVQLVSGRRTLAILKLFVKPFVFLYKVDFLVRSEVAQMLTKSGLIKPQLPVPNTPSVYRAMRFGMFQNRGFTDIEFHKLDTLISRLHALGAVTVYVHMPVPSYLKKDFFLYDQYREKIRHLSRRTDVHVLDLSDGTPDEDFTDDSHPVESAKKVWTEKLAVFLKESALTDLKSGAAAAQEKSKTPAAESLATQ